MCSGCVLKGCVCSEGSLAVTLCEHPPTSSGNCPPLSNHSKQRRVGTVAVRCSGCHQRRRDFLQHFAAVDAVC